MARLNEIQNYLQNVRPQTSPLDSAMLLRSLTGGAPQVKGQDAVSSGLGPRGGYAIPAGGYHVPNAGQYGAGATLPSNSGPPDPNFGDAGPIEPPILTGEGPTPSPTGLNGPARSAGGGLGYNPDPRGLAGVNWLPSFNSPAGITGYGTTAPSGVYGAGGGPTVANTWWGSVDLQGGAGPGTAGAPGSGSGGLSLGSSGALQGGNRGPQGTVYGTDPNTGNPIFNATGSPAPGFFDSTTGKIAENVAAGGLNFFVPGLGFVSKFIFDQIRNKNKAHNTGTDLTGNQPAGGDTTSQSQQPSGPAWFQRGYQPPAGIQAAINRGDYQSAYGQSAQSAGNNFQMWAQSLAGNPNSPPNGDEGPNRFYNGRMQLDAEGGLNDLGPRVPGTRLNTTQLSNNPSSIAAYNAAVSTAPAPLPTAQFSSPMPLDLRPMGPFRRG